MTHPLPRTEDTTRNRGIGVLVLMALLLPPAIWSLSKVDLNNDIRRWLPSDDPNALALNWYHEYFPESDTALVSWEGSTLNEKVLAESSTSLQTAKKDVEGDGEGDNCED